MVEAAIAIQSSSRGRIIYLAVVHRGSLVEITGSYGEGEGLVVVIVVKGSSVGLDMAAK